jgi:hypothetical protein
MNTLSKLKSGRGHAAKQRGVVLFFTLIALVVMSLAAVALIRSVDTSTMIAGNLAFRQSGTSSTDTGMEAAIGWLSAAQATMQTAGKDVYQDADHVLNNDGGVVNTTTGVVYSTFSPPPIGFACCANNGYFSSYDPTLNLTNPNAANPLNWSNNSATVVVDQFGSTTDSSGNTIQYVIQRMCRAANTLPATSESAANGPKPAQTGCLFSNNAITNNETRVLNATEVCQGAGCAKGGQTVLMRITVRTTGPKNSVSYAQSIVY